MIDPRANTMTLSVQANRDAVSGERRDVNPQVCGYFSGDPNHPLSCGGSSICSSSPGARSWGCCDTATCYIPATCRDSSSSSLLPPTSLPAPIMSCTYGTMSVCAAFILREAGDKASELTSWGCYTASTTWFLRAEPTGPAIATTVTVTQTPATTTGSDVVTGVPTPPGDGGGEGLPTRIIAAISVAVPVGCAAVLAVLVWYLRHRKRKGALASGMRPSEVVGNSGTPAVPEIMSSPVHELPDARAGS